MFGFLDKLSEVTKMPLGELANLLPQQAPTAPAHSLSNEIDLNPYLLKLYLASAIWPNNTPQSSCFIKNEDRGIIIKLFLGYLSIQKGEETQFFRLDADKNQFVIINEKDFVDENLANILGPEGVGDLLQEIFTKGLYARSIDIKDPETGAVIMKYHIREDGSHLTEKVSD